MTDLVERLRYYAKHVLPNYPDDVCSQAVSTITAQAGTITALRTALEAQAKEIEALRADAERWKDEHACSEINFQRALARAETAEKKAKQAEACCDSYADENQKLHDRADTAERERVAQWNRRREAESQRDVEKAVVETLRRERDQAREALKLCIPILGDVPGGCDCDSCVPVREALRAARAITGED